MINNQKSDLWGYISKSTHKTPFFSLSPNVCYSFNRYCIKQGRYGILYVLWSILAGGSSIYFAVSTKIPIIFVYLCFALGIILFYGGLKAIIRQNKISWSRYGNTLNIQLGNIFSNKQLILSNEEILTVVYACNEKQAANSSVSKGDYVLAIRRLQNDNSEIRVASSENKSNLMHAFESLNNFLINKSTIETIDTEVTLYNGSVVKTSIEPLRGGDKNFHELKMCFPSDNTLVLKRPLHSRLSWWITAIIFTVGTFILFTMGIIDTMAKYLLFLSMAIAATAFVGPPLLFSLGRRSIIINLTQRLISFKMGIFGVYRNKDINPFYSLDQIGAIQICTDYEMKRHKNFNYYELNLILDEPPGYRINVNTYYVESDIHKDAKTISEFIKKPLIDHTKLKY